MAAEGGNNIIRFTYTGADGERIPSEATHITISEDCTFVRARAFYGHRHIVEVICHKDVEKIGEEAFYGCWSLRRVVMPGVKIVEVQAFFECDELVDVECGKLEIIRDRAFGDCYISLRSINLPSAVILRAGAFSECNGLTEVKFGSKLERIVVGAFRDCHSLERITIPLKDGIITDDDIFQGCEMLKHVDLIEGELHETIAALQLKEWRNDMSIEIDSINQILLDTHAGACIHDDEGNEGGKARAIRRWIRSVLFKIAHYQAEHRHVLDEAAATLRLTLPHDIVMKNVLSFLELPPNTFG